MGVFDSLFGEPFDLNKFFDKVNHPLWSVEYSGKSKDIYTTEDPSKVYFHFVIPGYKKAQLLVTIDKGVLTVHGEHQDTGVTKSVSLLGRVDIDLTAPSATLEDGILTVAFTKTGLDTAAATIKIT